MRFTYIALKAAQAKWSEYYCESQLATPLDYTQLGQLQAVARLALTQGTLSKARLEELLDLPALNFVVNNTFPGPLLGTAK
jgi:hypothetical protein